MPRLTRSTLILRKAEAALLAAIEIYNKPSVLYREEAFVILVLNAWELLLKARLIALNGNRLNSVFSYHAGTTKAGKTSKRLKLEKTSSGSPKTISFWKTFERLQVNPSTHHLSAVRANLEALWEIRNASSHFVNTSPQLSRQVLAIGTACVSNFIDLGKSWFSLTIQDQNLYLLPIAFFVPPGNVVGVAPGSDERKLLSYLAELQAQAPTDPGGSLHFAIDVSISMTKKPSGTSTALTVMLTNDPSAPKVTLTEEDIRMKYPWDYGELNRRLGDRFRDFKQSAAYHATRKRLESDEKFAKVRFLDPGNPKSPKKRFYNPNILQEFDNQYTRKN